MSARMPPLPRFGMSVQIARELEQVHPLLAHPAPLDVLSRLLTLN